MLNLPLECSQLNLCPEECQTVSDKCQIGSDECQTEISKEKCGRYNKYSFHDFLIQSVTYIETQPSNKEYFESKGTLDKQIKMDNKTK